MVKQWSKLPRAVLESASLEVIKRRAHMDLRETFSWCISSVGLVVRLMILEFFSNLLFYLIQV